MNKSKIVIGIVMGGVANVMVLGTAIASANPQGTGQPGAPNNTCQQFTVTPGNAGNANGSPFNPTGTAGNNYAGNPGTASSTHSNSQHAISQYDVACFQQTTK